MNITTHPASTLGTLALRVAALFQSRPRTALIAVMLVIGLIRGGAPAAAQGASAPDLRLGHTVERTVVAGAAQSERRQVDVHVWYPADPQGFSTRPKVVYKSALHGEELYPDLWDPLSWTVTAEIAREGAAIDPAGGPFPVIVFSHGSTNDPIDYAWTLEAIAAAGFVVAAPAHTGNTQDDVRRDYINAVAGSRLWACEGGRPARPVPTLLPNGSPSPDCSKSSVPNSMADRARDISAVLDELPGWFGGRVDVARAGVMGHSRGTVTALPAAGGSAPWSAPTV